MPVAGIKAKPDNPNGLFGVVLGLNVDDDYENNHKNWLYEYEKYRGLPNNFDV